MNVDPKDGDTTMLTFVLGAPACCLFVLAALTIAGSRHLPYKITDYLFDGAASSTVDVLVAVLAVLIPGGSLVAVRAATLNISQSGQ